MLDSAYLADAELRVRAWLTSPRPQAADVADPSRPLTKDEQKARIRAGMERDRAQRQALAAQRRR